MNSTKSKTVALVGFVVGSLPFFQAGATNIVLGPGNPSVVSSSNQFIGIGNGNVFDGIESQLAVGDANEFEEFTMGAMFGHANTLEDNSYGSILVGQGNASNAGCSVVFGEDNSVSQDTLQGWLPGNFVSGMGNQMTSFKASMVVGWDNDLIAPASSSGYGSMVVGAFNELNALTGWVVGFQNEATGDASSTIGWGLLNPGYGASVIGTFNKEIEGSSSTHEEDGAAFVVGNGIYTSRSNAIETLKNGETTLINKAWNPSSPLGVPVAADSAGGRALVVDGHTLLKGQVIIAEPQGDISMGDYTE